MSNKKNAAMPRTPFSTPLSGSAKETKRRLENIMNGPQRRPPVIFIVLVSAFCLLCGNLVSCQMSQPEETAPDRMSNSQQGDVSLSDYTTRAVPIDPECPPRTEEEWLLQALFTDADSLQPFQDPKARLVDSIQKDGYLLGAALVEDHLENSLVLGVMDRETHELTDAVFRRDLHAGVLNTVPFQNSDGEPRLLYTFNGPENGQLDGEAGMVRFNGTDFAWQWPVEGDVRYPEGGVQAVRGAMEPYQEYWDSHLALLAPGGVDVYTVNPDFVWGGDEPMWQLDHGETFWYDSSSAEELPMPVYFQSLSWLNETMEPEAGWRILSLVLDEEKCDPEGRVDCYTLWAHTDNEQNELMADLYFPYEQEGVRRSYGNLDHGAAPAEETPGKGGGGDEKQEKDDDWDWDWADKWDEKWEKEQEAKQIAEYQSVGVTMDGKNYYYQGQLVNIFLDQRPDKSVYTLDQNPAGTVNVKILRAEDGTITGAAYLTEDETAELAELFED